jgi:hypothetical protein
MGVTSKERAQNGRGIRRATGKSGEFLHCLAARNRALSASRPLIMAVTFMILCACSSESSAQRRKEADTPAGKVGQVAYQAAKVTGKVAKAAGKELSKAAHDAHEGWNEAAQKDKAKQ